MPKPSCFGRPVAFRRTSVTLRPSLELFPNFFPDFTAHLHECSLKPIHGHENPNPNLIPSSANLGNKNEKRSFSSSGFIHTSLVSTIASVSFLACVLFGEDEDAVVRLGTAKRTCQIKYFSGRCRQN
ncbi:hypothetical protein Droror1_Dr00008608 [Drosera rotundifolia]